MSHVEAPTETTLRFIQNWTDDSNRLAAELVSLNRETHREPDLYHFFVSGDVLLDPETGRPILDFVAPGLEYQIAERLQRWAAQNDAGVAYWISPRLPGIYPCNKIIIHNIAYDVNGRKVVMNSAILFEADLENPEEYRRNLFTAEDTEETFRTILNWLSKVSQQEITLNPAKEDTRTQAVYFAERIRLGIDPQLIIAEMQNSGFLGQHSISCPMRAPSFSAYVEMRARRMEATGLLDKKILCCTCPFCNKQVKAEIYDGRIHCPECGESREWKEEQSQSL